MATKKKTKTNYRVQFNDIIEVFDFDKIKHKNKTEIKKYKPSEKEKKIYGNFIIENNDNFVVINKPAGIPVQSGTKSFKNIIEGDFVYIDPPYAPENSKSFVKYTESGFDLNCHNRLFDIIKKIDVLNVKFLLSNANVELVKK